MDLSGKEQQHANGDVISVARQHLHASPGRPLDLSSLPQPPEKHFPRHPDLPWHFSWIDSDCMIGGSSAPTERRHWKAFKDCGVGLVVNLTESPVSPPRFRAASSQSPLVNDEMAGLLFGTVWDDIDQLGGPSSDKEGIEDEEYGGICAKCGHVDEVYDNDLFADVATPVYGSPGDSPESTSSVSESDMSHSMAVLFLPIPDGSVPRFEQLDIFLQESKKAVSAGKKVIVHCQAGVGRTGTFLAAYLIDKYHFDPLTAITALRRYRPQSLQFHATDWQVDPFRLHPDPKAYNRNMVQERFVERWWYAVVKERKIARSLLSPTDAALAQKESRHHRRRSANFMEDPAGTAEDGSGSSQLKPGKQKRRYTDSGPATYNGFVEYLLALSKQQHVQQTSQQSGAKQSFKQEVIQSTVEVGLSTLAEDASRIPSQTSASVPINVHNRSGPVSSIVHNASSLTTALSGYPTPPRMSDISSSLKRAEETAIPNTPPGPIVTSSASLVNNSGFLKAPLMEITEDCSESSEGGAKLSASLPSGPSHPYSRTVGGVANSYHPRKRHSKLLFQNHSTNGFLTPKTTSFNISPILLRLIDQQLDSKFAAFSSPCALSHLRHPETRRSYRIVQASGNVLPETKQASKTLCYGCRGVVAVGPEPVVHTSENTENMHVVWPSVVPYPKQGDERRPSVNVFMGSSLASPRTASPTTPCMAFMDMTVTGDSMSGGFTFERKLDTVGTTSTAPGIAIEDHHGIFGESMEMDGVDTGRGLGRAGLDSVPIIVGSATSELNGAVEALKLEEAQRKEISLAVRNRIV